MKWAASAVAIATLWLASMPSQASAHFDGYRSSSYVVHDSCWRPRSFGAHVHRYYKTPRRWAYNHYGAPRSSHRHYVHRHYAPCHHGCGEYRKHRHH